MYDEGLLTTSPHLPPSREVALHVSSFPSKTPPEKYSLYLKNTISESEKYRCMMGLLTTSPHLPPSREVGLHVFTSQDISPLAQLLTCVLTQAPIIPSFPLLLLVVSDRSICINIDNFSLTVSTLIFYQ